MGTISTVNAAPLPRLKPATLDVVTVGRLVGIGRNKSYELAAKGAIAGIPVITVGRQRRVPTSAVEAKLGIDILDHLTVDELGVDDDVDGAA